MVVTKVPVLLKSVLVLLETDENALELPDEELELELAVPDGLVPELPVVDPVRLETPVDCSVPGPTAFDTLVRPTEVDENRLEVDEEAYSLNDEVLAMRLEDAMNPVVEVGTHNDNEVGNIVVVRYDRISTSVGAAVTVKGCPSLNGSMTVLHEKYS
jgi:hypothetical protein